MDDKILQLEAELERLRTARRVTALRRRRKGDAIFVEFGDRTARVIEADELRRVGVAVELK